MDQDRLVYIVVDRVGASYRVLLYQPSIRFSLLTNTKVLSLQHNSLNFLILENSLLKYITSMTCKGIVYKLELKVISILFSIFLNNI